MQNKRLFTIFLIVFIDLLGFGLILPLIPFYAADFGANATVAGLLVASYAAAQLVGAPILGRLSDRYGRRPVLLISIFGTFVSLLFLGVANSLWMLFLSRIIDGLTGGNISVAQAYISDVTEEKDRAKAYGLIGAAFGLGFIIGPAMGGLLSQVGLGIQGGGALNWQYALPAFAAAGLTLLNLIAVYLWLPESLTAETRTMLANRPRPEFSLQALQKAFQRPRVGPLLHIRFFFSLAFATFQTVFPLYALYRFDLDQVQTAYILTYAGVLIVLVQGVGIRWLAERFSDSRLLFSATVLMSPALLLWALAPSVTVVLISLIPIAIAGGIFNTIINSALSKSVYPEEVGGTLGFSAALESSTRVIGPSAGGALLQTLGTWAPGVFGALITAWLATFIYRRLITDPDPPLPTRNLDSTSARA